VSATFSIIGLSSADARSPFQPWTAQRLQRSLTGHLNRGIDGVFEIVRVVSRGLVSIAEVHAIVARAQQAQRESKMSRNRFGFLECHG
jgi:hypothetical protein